MWVAYKPVGVEIDDNGTRICIWNKYDDNTRIDHIHAFQSAFQTQILVIIIYAYSVFEMGPDLEKRRGLSATPELSRIV